MELSGKKVFVAGLARTGEAVCRFCVNRGAKVTVTDRAPEKALGERAERVRDMGAELLTGPDSEKGFTTADLLVLSPGVPHTIPAVLAARSKGVEVVGEIELAGRFIREPIVAVTGSNGKSTVTELVGEMLRQSGKTVFVGGNIGDPLIGYADRSERVQVVVAEISSFQTDTLVTFAPAVGVLLNITPDHLDRYPSMAEYALSKARLFARQTVKEHAVLNGGDLWIGRLAPDMPGIKLFYGRDHGEGPGADIRDKEILCAPGKTPDFTVSLKKTALLGEHNRENIAAASLAASLAGADPRGIQKAVDCFQGLPHRIQSVAQKGHVVFVDDSKATNVDAVVRALDAVEPPVALILGGRDKDGDFEILRGPVKERAAHVVLIGEAAEIIEKALAGTVPMTRASSMAHAVALAYEAVKDRGTVLLSPACASFDWYESYARRGEDFAARARELGEDG